MCAPCCNAWYSLAFCLTAQTNCWTLFPDPDVHLRSCLPCIWLIIWYPLLNSPVHSFNDYTVAQFIFLNFSFVLSLKFPQHLLLSLMPTTPVVQAVMHFKSLLTLLCLIWRWNNRLSFASVIHWRVSLQFVLIGSSEPALMMHGESWRRSSIYFLQWHLNSPISSLNLILSCVLCICRSFECWRLLR